MHSNHHESDIFPIFSFKTNLKWHSISLTSNLIRKVITNSYSSKVSSSNYIPVVVLKNCKTELSYVLDEIFNMCLKKSYFPNCLKILSTVSIFNNVGERSNAKYYCLNSCLSVGSKIFEKLGNVRLLNPLENCGLFLISSMILVPLNQWKI